ncbi:MAG: IS630 family transposase [Oscillospiraceae bacterium]|nr:IS630 family transposase [Oscillospiraceae bacterium]MBR0353330.1 IS630 family transposase [Oscillospiraceae bacterium]
MAKNPAQIQTPEVSRQRGGERLKKIKSRYDKLKREFPKKRVRLLFQDEAGFGRINKPKYCWCKKGMRPSVPCHHIREYRYAYGAVETRTGDGFFLVLPYCDTTCMNVFLHEMAKTYPDDELLLVCDGARWHRSNGLKIPENIHFTFIPPYTPEMNPIEQIWKEIRKRGFRNEAFTSLDKVIERLCDTIKNLPAAVISSITGRDWILNIY